MANHMYIMLQVSKKQIENKDTSVFTKRVEKWLVEYRKNGNWTMAVALNSVRSSMYFSISGYDSDPRETYEIPEIRAWFAELLRVVPHVLYFVHPEHYFIVFAMYASFKKGDGGVYFPPDQKPSLNDFLVKSIENSRIFAKKFDVDPDEVSKALFDNISSISS